MYKTILVPLDGSERAEKILPHAKELARKYDATLVLIQVITPLYHMESLESPGYYQVMVDDMRHAREEVQRYLSNLKDSLMSEGVETRFQIEEGDPVQRILNVADDENIDLIAMSSHGRTGLPRVFYGSVSAGILHATRCPILLIRSNG